MIHKDTMDSDSPTTPRELESQVAALYRNLGYAVTARAHIADRELDLLAEMPIPGVGTTRVAVECKYRSGRNVSTADVDYFLSLLRVLLNIGSVTHGVLVTNRAYTRPALRLANTEPRLSLLTLDDLKQQSRPTEEFRGEGPMKFQHPTYYLITSFELVNIRCFRHLRISLDDSPDVAQWIMILGDNAAGKTTLLRSIALGLCREGDAMALMKEIPGQMIRQGEEEGKIAIRLRRKDDPEPYTITTRIIRSPDSTELIQRQTEPEDNLSWSDVFVCGYGTQRVAQATASYENYSSLNALRTLFNYEAPLQNPEVVLLRHDPELRKILERKILDVLMLNDNGHALNYRAGGMQLEGPWGLLPFDSLSDGYRSTMQWILDFIGWAIYAGRLPQGEIGGILLIDELEAHLHPRWQRHIVQRLRRQFPDTQIFASTHTPLTASGVTDIERSMLIRLRETDEGGITAETVDPGTLVGKRADQVLASDAFGLATTRSPGSQDDLSRYAELLGRARTPAEQRELEDLKTRLHDALAFGESPFEQLVEKAVTQTLEKLLGEPPEELLTLEARRRLRELFRSGETS